MSLNLLRKTWRAFNEDKALRLAAAIAFSAIFSLAPLLIVLIAVAGWFLGISNGGHGHHVAEAALLDQVRKSAGAPTAETVRQLIAAAFNKPRQNVLAQIVGWVAFAFGAAALFSALQDSLNAVWGIEATGGGWKQMLRDRLSAFGMVLIVGLLLLLTVVVNAGIAFATTHRLGGIGLSEHPTLIAAVNQLVTFVTASVAFAAIYRTLPDVRIDWRDVWVGGAATAALFVIGEMLVAWYLAKAGVASAYGAAGSLLVALLWIYYSAIAFLLGAEFTKCASGRATTTAPTVVRNLQPQPAGIDPRAAGATSPAAGNDREMGKDSA